jgi:uncharacterized sulfatase
MDERYDCVRSVTDGRYVYLRNYMPHLSHAQHVRTMFVQQTTQVWKKLFDENALTAAQASFWQPRRPEELYDLQSDPHEIVNLAEDPGHQSLLEDFRRVQREHLLAIKDIGFLTEAEMHRRAQEAGTTIGEVARDAQLYPMAEVLEAAELASSLKPSDLGALESRIADADPGVRYWAALGVLMRGSDTIKTHLELFRSALNDKNESLQWVAAQALALEGDKRDAERAIAVLQKLIVPQERNPYISIAALNVVDALGGDFAPFAPQLRQISANTASDSRTANYAKRLADRILARP